MAIVRYKVAILQKDAEELAYQEELLLNAENVWFDDPTYDNVQDALDNVADLVATLVVPISLVYNGTLSNGNFIGYSNLIPGDATPVIAPITGDFSEFTFSNNSANADFALEFRKNTTVGTPFYTWSVDNTQSAAVELVTPEPFTIGDRIYVKYIDEGTNAQDAAIVLHFKA
jgi:hypothetical protein